MTFDWKKAEESSGGTPIPDGLHLVKIAKIKKSKKRDDQIIVTFANSEGSIDSFYTLTEDTAWALAKLLSRSGTDLDKMKEDGIDPRHFAKLEVAEQYLLNAETWVKVYTLDRSNPKNCDQSGNPYRRAEPLHKAEAEKIDAARVQACEASTSFDDSIPF